jgi:hypothetical protein
MKILQGTDGDIEAVLKELWDDAFNAGKSEGLEESQNRYDEGYKQGQADGEKGAS